MSCWTRRKIFRLRCEMRWAFLKIAKKEIIIGDVLRWKKWGKVMKITSFVHKWQGRSWTICILNSILHLVDIPLPLSTLRLSQLTLRIAQNIIEKNETNLIALIPLREHLVCRSSYSLLTLSHVYFSLHYAVGVSSVKSQSFHTIPQIS